ncbi:stathmin-4-like isoform X2 [Phycodurus eques]|uniref:stathmin-4-like isoform X2 n=1 Tax=Phycodurus eques TaxID=693459 RepID=UPI002ACE685F|nr:stathmin-4-like isoform X2 [Phycodurus eques]
MTFSAHREKLRELPLVSLLCSCLVQKAPDATAASAEKEGTVDLKLGAIRHLEVSGHASGRAFQVILKPPSFNDAPPKAIAPPRRKPSPGEVRNERDAAHHTGRCQEAELLKHLAGIREPERQVADKLSEDVSKDVKPLAEKMVSTEVEGRLLIPPYGTAGVWSGIRVREVKSSACSSPTS